MILFVLHLERQEIRSKSFHEEFDSFLYCCNR